jgi:hypothetical protein
MSQNVYSSLTSRLNKLECLSLSTLLRLVKGLGARVPTLTVKHSKVFNLVKLGKLEKGLPEQTLQLILFKRRYQKSFITLT